MFDLLQILSQDSRHSYLVFTFSNQKYSTYFLGSKPRRSLWPGLRWDLAIRELASLPDFKLCLREPVFKLWKISWGLNFLTVENRPKLWCKSYVQCVSKNIPDIFDCNLKTDYQILIIFNTNILDTTCHQTTIQFPTSTNVCFCTTWENITSEISLFCPMRYDCLINIMRKNTFCLHFWHFGWQFIQLFIFQLPLVKLLEVLAHYVNTGKETLSSFIHSSID